MGDLCAELLGCVLGNDICTEVMEAGLGRGRGCSMNTFAIEASGNPIGGSGAGISFQSHPD